MTNLEKWRFIFKDYESPESYLDWSFYTMIAMCLQRRVWLYTAPDRLFANIFTVLCGPPATGKGRAITPVKNIMKHPSMIKIKKGEDGELSSPQLYAFGSDCSTFQKLLDDVKECAEDISWEGLTLKGEPTKFIEIQMSCCYTISEMATMLQKDMQNMVNLLNDMYDCQDYKYGTRHNSTVEVKNTCATMLFGTNPAFVHTAFKNGILDQGFFARCIVVYEPEKRFCRLYPGMNLEQANAFQQIVDHVKSLKTVCGQCTFSTEAIEWMKSYYESGQFDKDRINRDYHLDEFYGRKRTHWLKLCMIFNYMDQKESSVISLETTRKALIALQLLENKMSGAFSFGGRNPLYELQLNILRYLKDTYEARGIGVRLKKLWMHFALDGNQEEITQCVSYLTSTEQCVMKDGELRLVGKEYKPTPQATGATAPPTP